MTDRSPASLLARVTPDDPIRVVRLEGCQNFRDLGGYRTDDGRTVKWRMLYRSGTMHALTDKDVECLSALGIRAVVDLRSTNEREREPLAVRQSFAPPVFAHPYVFATSPLGTALPSAGMASEEARSAFQRAYEIIPYQFAGQFAVMFAQLLGGNVPIVINCAGGKDRTGVASALLLAALGVPRDAIVEDYLLSKVHFQPRRAIEPASGRNPRWHDMAPELMDVLRGVDRSYLDSAFAAIDMRSGGLHPYLETELGLSPEDLDRLRNLCLE